MIFTSKQTVQTKQSKQCRLSILNLLCNNILWCFITNIRYKVFDWGAEKKTHSNKTLSITNLKYIKQMFNIQLYPIHIYICYLHTNSSVICFDNAKSKLTISKRHGKIRLGGCIHSLGLCLQTYWTNCLLFHSSPVVWKHYYFIYFCVQLFILIIYSK